MEPTRRTTSTRTEEASLVRAITWAATAIAVVVTLAGPSAYAWLSWSAQLQDVNITARLHATFVTQAVSRSTSDWHEDVRGLLDADLVPQPLPEQRRIVDLEDRVVTETGPAVHWPALVASAPLITPSGPVGSVLISRSMWPIAQITLLIGLCSGALAVAIYMTLRVLPLRALGRALAALADEQARSRRDLEQYVDVLFKQAVDGILVFDAAGIVRSCNPRAEVMLGAVASAIVGGSLARWIDLPADLVARGVPPVGSLETMARRIGDDGVTFACELTVSALPVAGQESGFVGTLRDRTDRRTAERQLMQLANFDGLTGLPNRSLFRDRLGLAMQRALRSNRQMVVMFLDLDRFKTINDSLGHEAGDKLLQHVAAALTAALRVTDTLVRVNSGLADGYTVSRLGGDEFTVLAEQVGGVDDAAHIAQRIQQALQAPFHFGNEEIVVTGSMGITLYPQDDSSAEDLLKHADMAMYRAKETGRNGYQFYSEEMNAAIAQRLQLEGQLRHALARDEVRLVYQPKADLRTGDVTGVEVLLRWQREGEPVVTPDEFISVLEDMGLILQVGEWVLRQAACQVRDWEAAGLPALRLAVNLSARQLRQGEIVETVIATLAETGLPAAQLELELTESMLMDGETHADTLRRLSDLGLQLAIDDFGTGYSSLSYLKRFYVDTLKIDRSFVRDTPDDPEDCAITTAVIALGRSLNLRVVAEGVETEAQMAFLRERGCDEIQGYLLSRPLPPDAFVAWWHARAEAGASAAGGRRSPARRESEAPLVA